MTNLSCPLCNSVQYKEVYVKIIDDPFISLVQCEKCSHYFTLIKRNIDTDKLYNDKVYQVIENSKSIFDKILTLEYNKVLNRIGSFIKKESKTLLDFGSGKGKFASLALKKGWLVKCVETSIERAAYAEQVYGLEVNKDFYSSGRIFKQNFAVISLFHVLEHLPHPELLLKELLDKNLNTEGMVVIEVPNFSSFQSKIAKEKWMHLDVPRHVNHFTIESVTKLFLNLQFSVIRKEFFSLHLGVLGMLDCLMKKIGYRGNIIYQLKNKRSFILIIKALILLPFAFVLEWITSLFERGGVIRLYLRKTTK